MSGDHAGDMRRVVFSRDVVAVVAVFTIGVGVDHDICRRVWLVSCVVWKCGCGRSFAADDVGGTGVGLFGVQIRLDLAGNVVACVAQCGGDVSGVLPTATEQTFVVSR